MSLLHQNFPFKQLGAVKFGHFIWLFFLGFVSFFTSSNTPPSDVIFYSVRYSLDDDLEDFKNVMMDFKRLDVVLPAQFFNFELLRRCVSLEKCQPALPPSACLPLGGLITRPVIVNWPVESFSSSPWSFSRPSNITSLPPTMPLHLI